MLDPRVINSYTGNPHLDTLHCAFYFVWLENHIKHNCVQNCESFTTVIMHKSIVWYFVAGGRGWNPFFGLPIDPRVNRRITFYLSAFWWGFWFLAVMGMNDHHIYYHQVPPTYSTFIVQCMVYGIWWSFIPITAEIKILMYNLKRIIMYNG